MVTSSHTGHVLLFCLLPDGARVRATVRRCEAGGFSVSAVNLTSRAHIPGTEGLEIAHISRRIGLDQANHARRSAVAWMQAFPTCRLETSGRSFLETFTYEGIPIWWLFEISLQEKTFLIIRLVESVRRVIHAQTASHFAILGDNPAHPWQSALIERICQAAGLAPWNEEVAQRNGSVTAELEPLRVQDLLATGSPAPLPGPRFLEHIPTFWETAWDRGVRRPSRALRADLAAFQARVLRPLGQVAWNRTVRPWGHTFAVRVSLTSARLRRPIARGGALLSAWLAPEVMVLRGIMARTLVLIATLCGVILVIPVYLVFLATAVVTIVRAPQETSLSHLLRLVFQGGVLFLNRVLRIPRRILIAAASRWYGLKVVIASQRRRVRIAAASRWNRLGIVLTSQLRTVANGPVTWSRRARVAILKLAIYYAALALQLLGLRKARVTSMAPRTKRPRIAVVVDLGNLRHRLRLSTGGGGEYNPYLEGVLEEIRRQGKRAGGGVEVHVVTYGTRPSSGNRLRQLREQLQLALSSSYHALWWFARTNAADVAQRVRMECEQAWQRLILDQGFRQAFRYKDVDLWDVLSPDFRWAFVHVAHDSVLYIEAFRRLLQQIGASAVVMYNYEGALRKLCAATVVERIPSLGVQQALGPYGHGLNHRVSGYRPPTAPAEGFGCPVPEKIALWGERHRDRLFHRYGYPEHMLEVTGYTRLDAFARESHTLNRNRIRRRLGLQPDGKAVLFASVCRAAGTHITLEDHYIATFRELVHLVSDLDGVELLVKPWAGDNVTFIRQVVASLGTSKVVYIDPRINVHNLEILAVTNVVLTDLSSLLAEAWLMNNICIVPDYPETRHYFDDESMDMVKGLAWTVSDPMQISSAVHQALAMSRDTIAVERSKPSPEFASLFGPADGGAARRIALLAMDLAGPQPRSRARLASGRMDEVGRPAKVGHDRGQR